jgi:hypothetical protein
MRLLRRLAEMLPDLALLLLLVVIAAAIIFPIIYFGRHGS